MASLVADYDSDEDSEEYDEKTTETTSVQPGESGTNYLMSNDSNGSDSDDPKTEGNNVTEKLPSPAMEKLPAPKLGRIKKKDKNIHLTAASVFTNPFEKAEMAKQSILEKHVKLTEDQNPTGKKLKICKKFKLGKCPFGKNCKYSHVDLDSNLSLGYMQEEPEKTTENHMAKRKNYPQLPPPPKAQGFMGTMGTLRPSSGPKYSHQQMRQFREQERHMLKDDEDTDDRDISNDKRKRRIGVSQSLVPPKKAMNNLHKQRMEERPWTMKK